MFLTLQEFQSFTPKRPTYAIFGFPARHSLSPELHHAFTRKLNVSIDYLRIEIGPDEFPDAMKFAREKLCGFNCTHPFKQSVLHFLDVSDPKVDALHACNTVHVINGKFHGYNTDGDGFVSALALSGISLSNANVLLLGCGGAAAAIAYEASLAGAHLTVAARDLKKAADFCTQFPLLSSRCVNLTDVSGDYDIVVNATPVGMAPTADRSPVSLKKLGKIGFVYDTIYAPAMTCLLKEAADLGISYDNGLSMLLFQGAAAESHWFGHRFTQEEQTDVLNEMTAARANKLLGGQNLVLSGFMCSGKSTYGRMLADVLSMTFIDTDTALEQEFGCSVSEFFAKHGEQEFRKREAELAIRLSKCSGHVIALGGGTILNPATVTALKENGLILFLDTPFDVLEERFKNDSTRPLLRKNNVKELYDFRHPIYQKTADISVRVGSEHRAISQILNSIEGDAT